MNEVSCRVFGLCTLTHERLGVAKDTLLSGTPYTWSYMSNPRNRVDWHHWIRITDNAFSAVGDENRLHDVLVQWAQLDGQKPFRRLAGFFVSLNAVYLRLAPIMARSAYSVVVYKARRLPDGTFELRMEIPEPHQASRNFLWGGKSGFSTFPSLVGLPPARVESEITDRIGVYRIYPPEEKTLWRRLRVLPGSIAASVSFFRILREQNTEIAASYAQLEQQTTNLRNVLAASSDGIAVVRDGRLLHANPGLALILRFPSAEALIGQSTDQWADPADLVQLRAWAATRPSETERREVRLRTSSGDSVRVEVSAPRPIVWENQPAVLWLLRDITERRALETAVATARQREQASLARDLHDGLGQHLTGLAFKLKALETRLERAASPEAASAAEMVELANRATTHARDVAHGLAPVDLDPQGLVPALRLLCANVSHLFQLTCTLAVPEQPFALARDTANHLYRAAQEAITNAHRHGRAKTIELRLALDPATAHLALTIDDHGSGLPTEFLPTRSTGMGLKIMRHRLTAIGGQFLLEKSPTAPGARITLTAPLHFTPSINSVGVAFSRPPPASPLLPFDAQLSVDPPHPEIDDLFRPFFTTKQRSRSLLVVVVDDHAIVRTGLVQLLNQTMGFAPCREAATAAEAEALCALIKPDLLITDMLLGETTALDSIRRLRTAMPSLRIVVLSMYSRELYADAAREAGADAYVMKQSSPNDLLATLRDIFRHKPASQAADAVRATARTRLG